MNVMGKGATQSKKKFSFKGFFGVLKDSFKGFGNDNVTKLSGSLAYYTVFSMGPLLVVIISLCSYLYNNRCKLVSVAIRSIK